MVRFSVGMEDLGVFIASRWEISWSTCRVGKGFAEAAERKGYAQ